MSWKNESITISKSEYKQLIKSELELSALQDAGVDNWQGNDEVDWAWVREQMNLEITKHGLGQVEEE